MGSVFRARKGNKASRFFRLLFENKRIKKLFGLNLAVLLTAASFLPTTQAQAFEEDPQTTSAPLVIKTTKSYQFPLKKVKITQYYHFLHPGIDMDGVTGEPVYPVKKGTVISTETSKCGYGKFVLVDHGSGFVSLYAHLSTIDVKQGDRVTPETKIGGLGSTGRAFGDHLHLEIRQDGHPINPLSLLE
jgi:murein DD-endopeptidase MepM/ murein hydrolase activator NlpD